MVKKIFNRITTRPRIGFFAAIFLLFLSYILTFISTRKVDIQDFWMNHTNEVIHNLDNILGFISTGESSFRGYLLTNDNALLVKYNESKQKTDSTFSSLKALTLQNESQQKNLDSLHHLIEDNYSWIENIISNPLANQNISTFYLNGSEEGIANSMAIDALIAKMKKEEINLRNDWSVKISQYSGLIQVLNVLSIVIALLLTVYSLVVYNKENKEKNIASKKAEEYREELQERVNQLAKLNTELIELRRLEKYVVTGRIARVMAHEVRNPLTNINLACEQLRAEVGNKDSEIFFTMINRNSKRINQLVSDLLAATRAELSFSEASINDILDASLELALDRIQLNQIKVIKNYDENICSLPVDIEKIKIAFLNIIVNAVEAMDENGILEISTENQDGKCVVKISDNGKGMKKTEIDRLFEPYFTTKEKGTGLGLANSQNIIIGHKGSIFAESELGKGTSFTITFNYND
ncbi:MAG: CHASE3 domain-containing protein [Bacteroidota bacterium]|nr:CHASE3 domain-containing protein [Bacteroidota bacterium]